MKRDGPGRSRKRWQLFRTLTGTEVVVGAYRLLEGE